MPPGTPASRRNDGRCTVAGRGAGGLRPEGAEITLETRVYAFKTSLLRFQKTMVCACRLVSLGLDQMKAAKQPLTASGAFGTRQRDPMRAGRSEHGLEAT